MAKTKPFKFKISICYYGQMKIGKESRRKPLRAGKCISSYPKETRWRWKPARNNLSYGWSDSLLYAGKCGGGDWW